MTQDMKSYRSLLIASTLLATITACSPQAENRGHVRDSTATEQVKAGVSRMEVMRLLGSPSSQSSFGEDVWYYISSVSERTAFFKPKVAEQSVLAVHFDKNGMVSTTEEYRTEDGKRVDFAKDTTPTGGQATGVINQLLGNMGRFNNGKQIDSMSGR
ncbi:MAG: outer membrane protein assembly factor BamE [Alphaproteobacteria bacterium]|nr:outer membrane protein assembly factor BamE [Alphaproteobacteria bacterium]